jgi:hypothetical protein
MTFPLLLAQRLLAQRRRGKLTVGHDWIWWLDHAVAVAVVLAAIVGLVSR